MEKYQQSLGERTIDAQRTDAVVPRDTVQLYEQMREVRAGKGSRHSTHHAAVGAVHSVVPRRSARRPGSSTGPTSGCSGTCTCPSRSWHTWSERRREGAS